MKKIGVWGFGVVGKSVVNYALSKNYTVSVYDSHQLSSEILTFFKKNNIKHYPTPNLFDFLENNSEIIPSPGIDLKNYQKYLYKFCFELDIFYKLNNKFCIAITGSVGKTSIINALSDIIKSINIKVWTGGNIGTGMLDFLKVQNNYDLVLLELSSFQLEYCKYFAPNIAVITNIYPNHLNRHQSFKNYIEAKKNILNHQSKNDCSLLPSTSIFTNEKIKNNIYFFSSKHDKVKNEFQWLLKTMFKENFIIIQKIFMLLEQKMTCLKEKIKKIKPITIINPKHRLQLIKSYKGIDIYNDSKSTTTASTLAAIKKLKNKPILLIIGGLSKGVDRKPFIKALKNKVKKVYIFGKEKDTLKTFCDEYNILSKSFNSLKELIQECLIDTKNNDQILFSPSGSSFDLYKNYEERGKTFMQLIQNYNFIN